MKLNARDLNPGPLRCKEPAALYLVSSKSLQQKVVKVAPTKAGNKIQLTSTTNNNNRPKLYLTLRWGKKAALSAWKKVSWGRRPFKNGSTVPSGHVTIISRQTPDNDRNENREIALRNVRWVSNPRPRLCLWGTCLWWHSWLTLQPLRSA